MSGSSPILTIGLFIVQVRRSAGKETVVIEWPPNGPFEEWIEAQSMLAPAEQVRICVTERTDPYRKLISPRFPSFDHCDV